MQGAKEIYEQVRQAEIDSLSPEEIQERQYLYCNGCGHNWQRLSSMETDGDEEYEFCPVCYTDEHLQEAKDGPVHAFNPITGEIFYVATGKIIEPPLRELPPVPKDPCMPWADLRYTKESQEAREDQLLDEYFKQHK